MLFPKTDVFFFFSLFYLQQKNSIIRWLAFRSYLIVEDMISFISNFFQKWEDRATDGYCWGRRMRAVFIETTPGLDRSSPFLAPYGYKLSAHPDKPGGHSYPFYHPTLGRNTAKPQGGTLKSKNEAPALKNGIWIVCLHDNVNIPIRKLTVIQAEMPKRESQNSIWITWDAVNIQDTDDYVQVSGAQSDHFSLFSTFRSATERFIRNVIPWLLANCFRRHYTKKLEYSAKCHISHCSLSWTSSFGRDQKRTKCSPPFPSLYTSQPLRSYLKFRGQWGAILSVSG